MVANNTYPYFHNLIITACQISCLLTFSNGNKTLQNNQYFITNQNFATDLVLWNKFMIKTYPVSGMSCASCALNVERTLKRQPGIVNASVNYANASAVVEFGTESPDAASLQSVIRSIGYDLVIEEDDKNSREEEQLVHFKQLKYNTLWSIILALPVMIISMFFMDMPYANLIMLALTLPVLAWFGRVFFVNAYKQARHGKANMDSLVSLSTGIAFLFSVFNTVYPQFWHARGLHPHVYYEASAVVIAFILLGKVLEDRAKSKTSSAIKKLMGLQPNTVTLVDETGQEAVLPINLVKPGNLLRIKPGDKVPVDGEILSGFSFIDESTITGESLPVEKVSGNKVYAGTLNQDGSFILSARQVGSETILSRIIDMVRQAQGSKAPVQKTVDKIAGIFVPVVMAISIISFIVWMIFGDNNAITHALLAMVTVLVIACPCALGLATPTAIMVGMGKGASNGILIKDAESLERVHRVTAIVLDKTGTITEGKPAVTGIDWYVDGQEQVESEQILLTLEMLSAHPLAGAVVGFLSEKVKEHIKLSNFENISGKGIRGFNNGKLYLAGNLKLMEENDVVVPDNSPVETAGTQQESLTIVYFARNKELIGIITLADKIRDNSVEAIRGLQNEGIEVYMLTGDNFQTAQAVAQKTGIGYFKANSMPADKALFVKQLQEKGKVVAMVGDGINDSHAMAQADVSIAMGKGSDIAMDVAGMTIISSDLRQISKAIRLSKLTVNTVHQNLFWAFIYNLIGIPIAAGVLYPAWGFMLNPMIAAAAMAMSSVSVVSNSLRLRTKRL
jgi:Cu2+-exporting ATPase